MSPVLGPGDSGDSRKNSFGSWAQEVIPAMEGWISVGLNGVSQPGVPLKSRGCDPEKVQQAWGLVCENMPSDATDNSSPVISARGGHHLPVKAKTANTFLSASHRV